MANLQKGVLQKVRDYLDSKNFLYEVVIVDDGSSDGSVEFLEQFSKSNPKFILIKNTHMGKAGAVTTGMRKAKGEYVLFADMDQATPIEELDKILPEFGNGYDVVIGSRSTKRQGSPLSRRIISRSAMLLRRYIVGLSGITDTQCGFKAFTVDAASKIFSRIDKLHDGFKEISGSAVTAGFDVELLLIAKNLDLKIKEVPVKWLYVETRRVSPIRDSVQGVIELIKIRRRSIKGMYV
jgi:dolichyl-phosphate beta-glucosyltransferase